MHRAEGTHVLDSEAVWLDGSLEALQSIPGHVPIPQEMSGRRTGKVDHERTG